MICSRSCSGGQRRSAGKNLVGERAAGSRIVWIARRDVGVNMRRGVTEYPVVPGVEADAPLILAGPPLGAFVAVQALAQGVPVFGPSPRHVILAAGTIR